MSERFQLWMFYIGGGAVIVLLLSYLARGFLR